jgi:hypothetical protein
MPVVLAAITLAGLLSALLGDRLIWKLVGWLCLVIPVAASGWVALRARGSGNRR